MYSSYGKKSVIVCSLFPIVEEEKELNLVCNKKDDELMRQNKEDLEADSVLPSDKKIENQNESTLKGNEGVNTKDNDKEVFEIIECDFIEIEDCDENEGQEGKVGDKMKEGVEATDNYKEVEIVECDVVEISECVKNEDEKMHDKTEESVKDVADTDDEVISGDDECEVTSPDVIPSSQTPSFESAFQSLRRVTIPLESILPGSLQTLGSNRRNSERNRTDKGEAETKGKEVETVTETQLESNALEENEVEECDSPMKGDELPVKVTKASPVAGRTRRKLQQKTPSREKPQEEPTEQEVSRIMDKEKELKESEKLSDQTPMEKHAEPLIADVTRDATSSPVFNAKNKFLRPFAAGGSPCRITLRGRNSPGVSPTTGILKRWPGNKQGVDSPSPPGKVTYFAVN